MVRRSDGSVRLLPSQNCVYSWSPASASRWDKRAAKLTRSDRSLARSIVTWFVQFRSSWSWSSRVFNCKLHEAAVGQKVAGKCVRVACYERRRRQQQSSPEAAALALALAPAIATAATVAFKFMETSSSSGGNG